MNTFSREIDERIARPEERYYATMVTPSSREKAVNGLVMVLGGDRAKAEAPTLTGIQIPAAGVIR